MKRAYLKALVAAAASLATFLVAAAVTVHMFYFDALLRARYKGTTGGKLLEGVREYRLQKFQDTPTILFLCVAGIVLGILAIRFYNHAKSEFAD